MQALFWLAFLAILLVAIFAIQNSGASPVLIQFLFWRFETSLLLTIFGSLGAGILATLLFWIPREIRASLRKTRSPKRTLPDPHPPDPKVLQEGRKRGESKLS